MEGVTVYGHPPESSSAWRKRDEYYSDDSFIRTRLSPADTSGLTSFPDYWVAY